MKSMKNEIWYLVKSTFPASRRKCDCAFSDEVSNKLISFGTAAVQHIVSALEDLEKSGLVPGRSSSFYGILEIIDNLAIPEHLPHLAKIIRLDSVYVSQERSARGKLLDIFVRIGDKRAIPYLAEFRKRVRTIVYSDHKDREREHDHLDHGGYWREYVISGSCYNRMDSRDIREAIEAMLKKTEDSSSLIRALVCEMFEKRGWDFNSDASNKIERFSVPQDIDFAVEELCRRVAQGADTNGCKAGSAVFHLVCAILPRALPRHAEGICRALASDVIALDRDGSTRGRILRWIEEKVRNPEVLPHLIAFRQKIKKVDSGLAARRRPGEQSTAREAIRAIFR